MSTNCCPNCRADGRVADSPCRQCGWMPLQPSELQFVEDDLLQCPKCGRQRPVRELVCPHCGAQDVLEPMAEYTANYQISSLLLLMTLFAICFALGRISFLLGLIVFIFFAFGALRTFLLVRHRKRYRYPTALADVARMFALSLVGIFASIAVGGIVLFLSGFLFGAFFAAVAIASDMIVLVALLILAAVADVSAVFFLGWRAGCRRIFVIGIVVEILIAALAFSTIMLIRGRVSPVETILAVPPLVMALGALILACHHGGAVRAKAWIVGGTVGLALVGAMLMLVERGVFVRMIGSQFMFYSFLLWPLLLGIFTLQSMWSWDDAFPSVVSFASRIPPTTDEQLHALSAKGLPDDGIEFPDDMIVVDTKEPTTIRKRSNVES